MASLRDFDAAEPDEIDDDPWEKHIDALYEKRCDSAPFGDMTPLLPPARLGVAPTQLWKHDATPCCRATTRERALGAVANLLALTCSLDDIEKR